MTPACDICAAVEEVPSTFQNHRYGFPLGERWYCPTCWPDRTSSYKKLVLPGMLSLVVPGIILTTTSPDNQLGTKLILVTSVTIISVLALLLHELGHAFVGTACGIQIRQVVIGSGPIMGVTNWFGWRWEFRALPFSGYIAPLPTSKVWYRLKHTLTIAAGPLVNALLLLCMALLPLPSKTIGQSPLQSSLIWWFLFINAYYLFSSLWPRRVNIRNRRGETDGLQLLKLPFLNPQQIDARIAGAHHAAALDYYARKRYAEACAECEQALALTPDNWLVAISYSVALIEAGDANKAIEVCDTVLANDPIESPAHLAAANNKAIALLMRHPRNTPEEADRLSEMVYLNDRENKFHLLTRGSVLVTFGKIEEGLRLLYNVLPHHHERGARAWVTAYIALGEARRGRIAEAGRYLEEARTIDPSCQPLSFVQAELDRLNGSVG